VYLLLPPRQLGAELSKTRTLAPASRALNAAQSAALPPPTMTTSHESCLVRSTGMRSVYKRDTGDQQSSHADGLGLSSADREFARGSTAAAVAEILREAIYSGSLVENQWLREAEVAKELEVSRTPVREALRILELDGLVTRSGQAAVVAPVTLESVLQLYEVRETLEGMAARLAAESGRAELQGELEACLESMQEAVDDAAEYARLNTVFHATIRRATGNRYLERFLEQVESAVRRLGASTYETPGRTVEATEEHRRIANAIVDGDIETTERESVEHMRRAREIRIATLLGGVDRSARLGAR
jgi:DNA-binding GntR family transcriptional regulator